jgi:hypothetical protein
MQCSPRHGGRRDSPELGGSGGGVGRGRWGKPLGTHQGSIRVLGWGRVAPARAHRGTAGWRPPGALLRRGGGSVGGGSEPASYRRCERWWRARWLGKAAEENWARCGSPSWRRRTARPVVGRSCASRQGGAAAL